MLSFCGIFKNEEAALPACLNSVRDIVDEMIVLDTGSSDRTPEIARELGAKVYDFEWGQNFSDARNYALQYVQGDWVLVLDADEVLTPEIKPELQQAIQSSERILINLIRQEVGAVQSPYSLISRLFRKHPDVYFTRPYHSIVDDSIQILLEREPQWQIGYLSEVAILHYGYQPGAIASLNKFARAQAAMEGFFKLHPDDPYVCCKLGALYMQTGKFDQGIELLERGLQSIQKSPAPDPNLLYELYYHLGNVQTRFRNWQSAADFYQAAIQQPLLPKLKLGAYNNLGSLLLGVGDLATAKQAYETVLQIDPSFAIGNYNLGTTLKALGDLSGAIACYQKAIYLNPDYAEAYQNLGVALWKLGDVTASIEAFKQAIALHETQNPAVAQELRQTLQEMGWQV
jgi:tetratricopeptide (TPR) repeat protein